MFNAVTVIFIAATGFAAGLETTVAGLRSVFTDIPLLASALLANLVVAPLQVLLTTIGGLTSAPAGRLRPGDSRRTGVVTLTGARSPDGSSECRGRVLSGQHPLRRWRP
ncbi:hypothetical protein ACGF0D_19640 [Kitasatospora sp. NPDC048298]|uniref:hypothetical protein n=1 Tax=Kitasatospora sp. NPDC048298 TaxID=3364049 RepID=UPI00371C5295